LICEEAYLVNFDGLVNWFCIVFSLWNNFYLC